MSFAKFAMQRFSRRALQGRWACGRGHAAALHTRPSPAPTQRAVSRSTTPSIQTSRTSTSGAPQPAPPASPHALPRRRQSRRLTPSPLSTLQLPPPTAPRPRRRGRATRSSPTTISTTIRRSTMRRSASATSLLRCVHAWQHAPKDVLMRRRWGQKAVLCKCVR